VPIEAFFQEMLLSYRLIFGQDERSWKAFSKLMLQEEQNGMASSESGWSSDPMLETLCCKSPSSSAAKKIYDEIEASEPSSSYEPNTEFQFFGQRLLELQYFAKQHQPRNLKALLADRRDLHSWWALWANQVSSFKPLSIFVMANRRLVVDILCKFYNSLGHSAAGISDLASHACPATDCACTGTACPGSGTG
jgi:hypothetical protein